MFLCIHPQPCWLFVAAQAFLRWQCRASSCGGFSCRAQVLWRAGSAVVAPTLWSTGSVTVVHRLNCSKVCGILLDQGQTSVPHWQADSLLPDQQGNMRFSIFKFVLWDFPGGSVVRNLPANAGDMGLILIREDLTRPLP